MYVTKVILVKGGSPTGNTNASKHTAIVLVPSQDLFGIISVACNQERYMQPCYQT